MANNILGISAYYHDSAAVILVDGAIVAAAQEERFSRKKHDSTFPMNAIKYVLTEAATDLTELSAIVFYDKPFIKFERLLETYHAFAPRGLKSFIAAMPAWIKKKLFMRKIIWKELEKIHGGPINPHPPLLFSEHHLSHAASAFYPSPFDEAAILTIDGVGEWTTTTIGHGKSNTITTLREISFPHSLGLLYSAFTYYCGFRVNSGEYKLMGLAPYGKQNSQQVETYKQFILEHLLDLREDGSFCLNMPYFNFATGFTMCNNTKWEALFGFPKREPENELTQEHMDLALAIQQVTEIVVLRLAETARELTGSSNIVMAGGVALNCVANGKLQRAGLFKNLWIQPAAGDAGGALGAAYATYYLKQKNRREPLLSGQDSMQGCYLGPQFSNIDVERMIRKFQAVPHFYDSFQTLISMVADQLSQGKIIGWFQGRMEWGPRALGNRSILGDPRKEDMQKRLNLKIKLREGFRPFAPSVLSEDSNDYFDLPKASPYMLLVAPVQEKRRYPLPDNYRQLELYDRLYSSRSDIPAVTHVDFSARIQTVHHDTNKRYWQLIREFKKITGYGLIVNTSFNIRGEPIVCTPEDAYQCFMRTDMDTLVIGDWLFSKSEQNPWDDKEDWRNTYELD